MYALFKHHPQTLNLDSGTVQQSAPRYYLSTTSGAAFPGTTDNISLRTAPNRAGTPLTGVDLSFQWRQESPIPGPPFPSGWQNVALVFPVSLNTSGVTYLSIT